MFASLGKRTDSAAIYMGRIARNRTAIHNEVGIARRNAVRSLIVATNARHFLIIGQIDSASIPRLFARHIRRIVFDFSVVHNHMRGDDGNAATTIRRTIRNCATIHGESPIVGNEHTAAVFDVIKRAILDERAFVHCKIQAISLNSAAHLA